MHVKIGHSLAQIALLALGVTLAGCSSGAESAAKSDRHDASAPLTTAVPDKFTATHVQFADDKNGWALGDAQCADSAKADCPALLSTVDGGATWGALALPAGLSSTRDPASCGTSPQADGPCVTKVMFANPRVGYLWSFLNSYMTIDGGTTWTAIQPHLIFRLLAFKGSVVSLSAERMCSSACSLTMSSAPTGTTKWRPIGQGMKAPIEGSLLTSNANHLYFVDNPSITSTSSDYTLYTSSDATAWTKVMSPLCGSAVPSSLVAAGGALALDCGESSPGWHWRLSTDGGATFRSVPSPTLDEPGYFAPLSATRFVAAKATATATTLYLTDDAGTSWHQVYQDKSPAGADTDEQNGLTFTSPTDGYLVAADGRYIVTTDDGGSTWTRHPIR